MRTSKSGGKGYFGSVAKEVLKQLDSRSFVYADTVTWRLKRRQVFQGRDEVAVDKKTRAHLYLGASIQRFITGYFSSVYPFSVRRSR